MSVNVISISILTVTSIVTHGVLMSMHFFQSHHGNYKPVTSLPYFFESTKLIPSATRCPNSANFNHFFSCFWTWGLFVKSGSFCMLLMLWPTTTLPPKNLKYANYPNNWCKTLVYILHIFLIYSRASKVLFCFQSTFLSPIIRFFG